MRYTKYNKEGKMKIKIWESKDAEGRKIFYANRSEIDQPTFEGAVYTRGQAVKNLKEYEAEMKEEIEKNKEV
jgi:hypothetical protein